MKSRTPRPFPKTEAMCTLTFIPEESGYLVGMNRDELRTRPIALLPQVHERNSIQFVCPREPSGGTWIASNSQGNLLAMLNWNGPVTAELGEKLKSRGTLIPELMVEADLAATESCFDHLCLRGVFPFRLIAVFWKERTINEWRWSGTEVEILRRPWAQTHWFSSSLSDLSAERERGRVCRAGESDYDFGNPSWLRRLHRSHEPAPGPYSICVHREDAATVSYTEVSCCESLISMDYLDGNPCVKGTFDQHASIFLSEP